MSKYTFDDQGDPHETHEPAEQPDADGSEAITPPARTPAPSVIQAASFRCTTCGYDLSGSAVGSTCPECNTPIGDSLRSGKADTTQNVSGYAIASLVMGILSIMACFFYGVPSFVLGVLGLGVNVAAKRQVRRGEAGGSTEGLATAGLVCSIIGLVTSLVWIGLLSIFVFGALLAAAQP